MSAILGEHHLQTFSLLATQAVQAHTFIHVLNIDRTSTVCWGVRLQASGPHGSHIWGVDMKPIKASAIKLGKPKSS